MEFRTKHPVQSVRALVFFVLSFLSIQLMAGEASWPSPVDDKYQKTDPQLYAAYDEARNLLDRYAGESDFLNLGYRRLEYVLQKNDRFAPAYMQLARWMIMSAENEEGFRLGEAAVRKALAIEPEYADAWVLLGHIHTNLGDHEAALAALGKAEAIGTRSPWLSLNFADEYLSTGQTELAFEKLRSLDMEKLQSLKARRSLPDYYIRYFRMKGDTAGMDLWYRRAIEHDSKHAWSYGNYAAFLVWTVGDFVQAEELAREALALMDYGRGRMTLAAALYAQWASDPTGRSSMDKFDEARKIHPDASDILRRFENNSSTKQLAPILRKRIERMKRPNTV